MFLFAHRHSTLNVTKEHIFCSRFIQVIFWSFNMEPTTEVTLAYILSHSDPRFIWPFNTERKF